MFRRRESRCLEWGPDHTPWVLDQCLRQRGHDGPHKSESDSWDDAAVAAYHEAREAESRVRWQEIEDMIERGELTREQVWDRFEEAARLLQIALSSVF